MKITNLCLFKTTPSIREESDRSQGNDEESSEDEENYQGDKCKVEQCEAQTIHWIQCTNIVQQSHMLKKDYILDTTVLVITIYYYYYYFFFFHLLRLF